MFAAGEVPYNITVRALNLAGCGELQQIYCFTQEGGKLNLLIAAFNCMTSCYIIVFLFKGWYNNLHVVFYSVPSQPENVMVERIDSTSIMVTWDRLSLVDLKGLANYTITYSISAGGGSRKRQVDQGMMTVPWTENNVTITNLRPGAGYIVNVKTMTSIGQSGMCVCISLSISNTLYHQLLSCFSILAIQSLQFQQLYNLHPLQFSCNSVLAIQPVCDRV